jgi:arylsulfatase A-like enzyme
MPFPRVKGYAYHDSNHIPLAVRWPKGIQAAGRVIEDFVSFIDIAPTILDAAGVSESDSGMMPITGKSWRPIFESDKSGRVVAERDHVLVGKERTDVGRPNNAGYPIRGIVTSDFLYLRNYETSRWPAGNPETGYMDTDASPTKSFIIDLGRKERTDRFWKLNFGMRPTDELYSFSENRDCARNLASDAKYTSTAMMLRERMENELKAQNDPRMFGQGHVFDEYKPTTGDGFYEQFKEGKKVNAGWISPSDIEKEPIAVP